MKCPRCDEELESRESDGPAVVDVCAKCGGAWFQKGELDDMDDSVRTNAERLANRPVESDRGALSCPECASEELTAVSPVDGGDLVLDRCDRCGGFWLDPGELELISTRSKTSNNPIISFLRGLAP